MSRAGMQNDISAAATPREYGAEAGGDPLPRGAARQTIPCQRAGVASATARQGIRPAPVIAAASRATNCGGAPAALRDFWEAVTSGAIRLTPDEDALLWAMRARGRAWNRIAARIRFLRAEAIGPVNKGAALAMLRAHRRRQIAVAVQTMMGPA
jgi:hypothetical protein